jgi:hypothetical protein
LVCFRRGPAISPDGGFDELPEYFLALANSAWSSATHASNDATRASNSSVDPRRFATPTISSKELAMRQFDHEKLNVYPTSIHFVAWSSDLLPDIPKTVAVHNQLDRTSTSIPLNIAEGNGKFTPADRCRVLLEIVAMLVGLIRAHSPTRDI